MRPLARMVIASLVVGFAATSVALRGATARATSPASQASSSSSTAKTGSATAKKAPSKRRRRRSRKFVPKQLAPTAERIVEIQTALAHGGYYEASPTGKWDANTIAAMQRFQSANGIEVTGKIDAPSLQKLGLGSDIAGVSAPLPPRPVTPPSTSTPSSSEPAANTPPSAGTGSAATASMASGPANMAGKSAPQ